MLQVKLVSWKAEPQFTYKRYAYKKTCIMMSLLMFPRRNIVEVRQISEHYQVSNANKKTRFSLQSFI